MPHKEPCPFGLPKTEELQIVNLTPFEPVELYVVRPTPRPALPLLAHSFAFLPFPLQILGNWKGLENCMEEVLASLVSLTAPPPSSSPTAAAETKLALAA